MVLSLQSNIPYLPQNVPGLLWRWSCWRCFHQIGLGDVFFAARLAAPWQDGLLSSGQIYRWPHLIFQNTTEVPWHSTSIKRDGVQKKKMMAQMKSCPMLYIYIYYHFVCIWVLKESYISISSGFRYSQIKLIYLFFCVYLDLPAGCNFSPNQFRLNVPKLVIPPEAKNYAWSHFGQIHPQDISKMKSLKKQWHGKFRPIYT